MSTVPPMKGSPAVNTRSYAARDSSIWVPERLDDVIPSTRVIFKDITGSGEWEKRARGTRKAPRTGPLTRTDFPAHKACAIRQFVVGESWGLHSPVSAAFQAVANGPGAIKFATHGLRRASRTFEETVYGRTSDKASMTDILNAMQAMNFIHTAWTLEDIDHLIGAISIFGTAVVVIPWYESFGMMDNRGAAVMPDGKKLGLRALCVSAYCANGVLIKLDAAYTREFGNGNGSLWMEEGTLADLISDGGEAFAVVKPKMSLATPRHS